MQTMDFPSGHTYTLSSIFEILKRGKPRKPGSARGSRLRPDPGNGRDLPNFQFDPAAKVENVLEGKVREQ